MTSRTAYVDRIGPEDGTYFTAMPNGVPATFEARSLPVSSLAEEYHRYQLTGYLPEGWRIVTALAAPAFGQPGGSTMVWFRNENDQAMSAELLMEAGVLAR